jgi:predicted nucleotidyltransferase
MMIPTSVGDALFTKTQQRVLGLLYGNPEKSFYTNEIMRLAGMGRGTVRRELDRLLSAGLLVMRQEGNQQHYQANPDSPVFDELRSIVMKSFGVVGVLRDALLPLSGEIEHAFVYGSVASGTERLGSDIDLMVVGRVTFEALVAAVYPCQKELGREISPNLFTPEEFERRMKERHSFIAQVMERPKLMVLGREDDIGESGQSQKAGSSAG